MAETSLITEILAGASLVANACQAFWQVRASSRHNAALAAVESDKARVQARLAAAEEQKAKAAADSSLVRSALDLLSAEERAKNKAVSDHEECRRQIAALEAKYDALGGETRRLRDIVDLQTKIDREDIRGT
jgi:hypothetical protein